MQSKTALQATQLTKIFGFGENQVSAVTDVSLSVMPGELILIMGPSGSGKTTLLSMLGGLLHPTSGELVVGDTDIWSLPARELCAIRARSIGFIFQSFNLLEALTVEENIMFPARLIKSGRTTAQRRAADLMARLGLTNRRKARPATLSGGEKQRAAIARALINSPPIILADEPTGNLDSKNGQDVMMILHDVARDQGTSVILVTHDPRVEDVADRVLWLEDGQLQTMRTIQRNWAKDPVCGMRIDVAMADIKADWKNHTYYFCSYRCLSRFQSSPDEHAPYVPGE